MSVLWPAQDLVLSALRSHPGHEDVVKNALYCLGNLATDER